MLKLKSVNWKDIARRASKTFIQTFLSYLTIDNLFDISDGEGFKRFALTTGISALAAGISSVWNFIMEIVSEKAAEAIDKIGDDTESEETEVNDSGTV